MKARASLAIIEQLVMVLVFAVTAALCLGLFAAAARISGQTQTQLQADLLARNAAQLLKAGEDPAMLDTGELTLDILPLESPVPGYLRAVSIRVFQGEQLICTLETGWQEGLP